MARSTEAVKAMTEIRGCRTFCHPAWILKQAECDLSSTLMHDEILFRMRRMIVADYFVAERKAKAYAAKHAKKLLWC